MQFQRASFISTASSAHAPTPASAFFSSEQKIAVPQVSVQLHSKKRAAPSDDCAPGLVPKSKKAAVASSKIVLTASLFAMPAYRPTSGSVLCAPRTSQVESVSMKSTSSLQRLPMASMQSTSVLFSLSPCDLSNYRRNSQQGNFGKFDSLSQNMSSELGDRSGTKKMKLFHVSTDFDS
jgi:hypothetical protein